jgi:hypothetical protein
VLCEITNTSDQAYVASVGEAVRNRVERRASAKQTPSETAARLRAIAEAATAAIDRASKLLPDTHQEWRSTVTDFRLLVDLAYFHARKLVAADSLAVFRETGANSELQAARLQLGVAVTIWQRILELTKGELPAVDHDVQLLERSIALHERHGRFERAFDFAATTHPVQNSFLAACPDSVAPGTEYSNANSFGWVTQAKDSNTHIFRVRTGPGKFVAVLLKSDGSSLDQECATADETLDIPFPDTEWNGGALILKRAATTAIPREQHWPDSPPRPAVEHSIPAKAVAGKPLNLALRATPSAHVTGIRLHYRPLNQLEKFRTLEVSGSRASFTIPGADLDSRWDIQYYFEILHDGNGGWFHPNPYETTPYVVIRVQ